MAAAAVAGPHRASGPSGVRGRGAASRHQRVARRVVRRVVRRAGQCAGQRVHQRALADPAAAQQHQRLAGLQPRRQRNGGLVVAQIQRQRRQTLRQQVGHLRQALRRQFGRHGVGFAEHQHRRHARQLRQRQVALQPAQLEVMVQPHHQHRGVDVAHQHLALRHAALVGSAAAVARAAGDAAVRQQSAGDGAHGGAVDAVGTRQHPVAHGQCVVTGCQFAGQRGQADRPVGGPAVVQPQLGPLHLDHPHRAQPRVGHAVVELAAQGLAQPDGPKGLEIDCLGHVVVPTAADRSHGSTAAVTGPAIGSAAWRQRCPDAAALATAHCKGGSSGRDADDEAVALVRPGSAGARRKPGCPAQNRMPTKHPETQDQCPRSDQGAVLRQVMSLSLELMALKARVCWAAARSSSGMAQRTRPQRRQDPVRQRARENPILQLNTIPTRVLCS